MTKKIAGPCGWQPDAAQRNIGSPYDSGSGRDRQPAHCELHDINIVARFPSRCPLATPNPLATLGQLQDAAWRVLGRISDDPELPDALALLDQERVCMACLDRILTHPTVRRLRAGKGVAA